MIGWYRSHFGSSVSISQADFNDLTWSTLLLKMANFVAGAAHNAQAIPAGGAGLIPAGLVILPAMHPQCLTNRAASVPNQVMRTMRAVDGQRWTHQFLPHASDVAGFGLPIGVANHLQAVVDQTPRGTGAGQVPGLEALCVAGVLQAMVRYRLDAQDALADERLTRLSIDLPSGTVAVTGPSIAAATAQGLVGPGNVALAAIGGMGQGAHIATSALVTVVVPPAFLTNLQALLGRETMNKLSLVAMPTRRASSSTMRCIRSQWMPSWPGEPPRTLRRTWRALVLRGSRSASHWKRQKDMLRVSWICLPQVGTLEVGGPERAPTTLGIDSCYVGLGTMALTPPLLLIAKLGITLATGGWRVLACAGIFFTITPGMPLLRPIYLKISVLFKDVSMDNKSFWLAANLLDIGSSANWTGPRVGANFPGSSLLILKGLR